MMGILDENAKVLENKELHDSLFLMTLEAPKIAEAILPGQFVHMEVPTLQACILRRPFSVYDSDPRNGTIEILYQTVGSGTRAMTDWIVGQQTSILGPIGNRWDVAYETQSALLVGGGVGAAPLFMLAKELLERDIKTDIVLGSSTESMLVCRERYLDLCKDGIYCTTDDGTYGIEGFATVMVERLLEEGVHYDYAAICGPEPLMRSASAMTSAAGIPTQVSLERRMACGIGACLSCTCDTEEGRKRVCIDGPIFDSAEVRWS